jgi:hypothetical protein
VLAFHPMSNRSPTNGIDPIIVSIITLPPIRIRVARETPSFDASDMRYIEAPAEIRSPMPGTSPTIASRPILTFKPGMGIELSNNQARPSNRFRAPSSSSFTASRPHVPFVWLDANELIWAKFDSLSMLSLTSFYVFRVETDSPKRMAREFVLNIPLTNEPSGRRERQVILDQIKSAQGLGGRVRQKFDAERSRKTVCKAISRSIEAIENVHPQLGLHLHKSINLGLEVSYSPDVVIDWLF